MAVEIREMNEEDEDHSEEYYNCGYDGMYKPKEKAIIFSCVGRDLKLPPLSKVHFPESLILKGSKKFSENVRSSHHVLDLISLRMPSPVLDDHNEQYENNYQSDNTNLSQCYDISESSSHPPLGTVPPQSQTSEVRSSQSVHEIILSEASSREEDISDCNFNNSTTANVEDFLLDENLKPSNSLPLKGRDDFQATTTIKAHKIDDQRNLWKETSDPFSMISVSKVCSDKKNGQKPLPDYLQTPSKAKKTKRANRKSAWKRLPDAFQTSPPTAENIVDVGQCTKPVAISKKLDEIYLRKNHESAICKLFGSKDRNKSFIDHFKSCNPDSKDSTITVLKSEEFPGLPAKQTQNSRKQSRATNLPVNQSKLKKEKSLLHANANTGQIGGKVETTRETKTPQVLIIENLPQDISKENLEDLLMDFGKVLSMELLLFCDKVTAQISMDSDLEGIICILNGSCAFGGDSEPIVCYQKK